MAPAIHRPGLATVYTSLFLAFPVSTFLSKTALLPTSPCYSVRSCFLSLFPKAVWDLKARFFLSVSGIFYVEDVRRVLMYGFGVRNRSFNTAAHLAPEVGVTNQATT